MGTKRLLVSIALSSMLVAYDFDATKFQSTEWSEFQKQDTTEPYYVWKNQNGNATPPPTTGVGVGFRFSGENIYFTKDNTQVNANNINDIWIIGSSGDRYIFLDFTNNTRKYNELGLHFRGGRTTGSNNHYVLLNTQYTDDNGLIVRGLSFNPSSEYGKALLSIIGYDSNTQGPCNNNTQGGCAPVSNNSLFVLRGTDVNDNILQRYYSHDIVFGTPVYGENFGTAVRDSQFKGTKIDFSGGYWDQSGTEQNNGTANTLAQTLTFNGSNAIEKDSVEFRIGSGNTTLRLANLGTKSLYFSNLEITSKLALDSVGSSIAGNILYGNDTNSKLNLIFANNSQNVTLSDRTTQALSSIISNSSYLGGTIANGANGAGTIGINDSAQVTFIGASSHRFGTTTTPQDSFQFIGSADPTTSTTNKVLFLNAGNLNGSIFSTTTSTTPPQNPATSKINFTLAGTSVTNLTMSNPTGTPTATNQNTLNAVFNSSAGSWNSTDSNLASYFESMATQTSKLSGNVTLGDSAKVNLVFNGAGTHDFSSSTTTITGGSTDSQIIFNNANGTSAGTLSLDSIKDFKGSILAFNTNITPQTTTTITTRATPLATATGANFTYIFNGYGANIASQATLQAKNAINDLLSTFNNASNGLANYNVNSLTATTSLNTNVVTANTQNTHFVFVGSGAIGSGADLSQAKFDNVKYTFVDFGEVDLQNTTKYGSATIALAGNSWVRSNINVAYSGSLDVSYANRGLAQSFFDNHLYGDTKKDVVLNFGGDVANGQNYSRFHNGFIVEGTKDSTYIFSNIGGWLDLNKKATQNNYTASFDTNGDGTNDKTITLTSVSNLQSALIANGINFYVNKDNYGGATIGFRDTNITGDLSDESFGIDAVFNTSGNLVENTYVDASGNRISVIEYGNAKYSQFVGNIAGSSKKRITFIGADSFSQNLTISGGTIDSQYNFYNAGVFTQGLIDKIVTNTTTGATGTTSLGSFSFDGGTSIYANITKDASTINGNKQDTESINIGVNTPASTLPEFAQGTLMQGTLGGDITKNAKFASGSSVVISGGNSSSVYDFSLSSDNALIVTKLDFANSKRVTNGTIATGNGTTDLLYSKIVGLDGLTSIAGTLSNTTIGTDSTSANQVRFMGNTNGSGGHWFVTESSTIDSLVLSNDFSLLTSANIRSGTHNNALAIVDLATYDWQGRCHDGSTTCNTTNGGTTSYDYYDLVTRDLGFGFTKKTLTIAPSTMNNGTTYNSLFSSNNGVFRLGLNLSASGDKADEIRVILTQDMQGSENRIQLIQSASTAQPYEYTSGDKIYVASVIDSTAPTNTNPTAPNLSVSDTAFRATEQYLGLGIFRTTLATEGNKQINTSGFNDPSLAQDSYWGKQWYIQSIHIESIDDAILQSEVINPLEGALLTPYFNLYTETNNMAKRMGELRGANDASGAWVKVIKGAMSGTNGYAANNTGVQGGFDKRTDDGDERVYWGVVGSFMNAWGNNYGLNLQSSSFALGFYRSALFASNSYFDIVGKYIYSQNTYNTSTLSFGGKDSSGVNSAYVSAEYGKRFGFKNMRGFFLQPQAEVIAGYIGAQQLSFANPLVTLNVDSKASFALIGRVGADVLSNFRVGSRGGFWRVGASFVQDFANRGQVTIDDNIQTTASRTHTISPDFRLLLSAGLDMRLSQNSRVYFEIDKSFFGSYNLSYVISAGFRYNFGANPNRRTPQSYPNFYEQQYVNTYEQ
ncbi:autotransporter outer membrane beta-barrel domain-containing protein [uncultured Helicobacter sp.]|uniref:autotransporter outer membrane beta-barrel domain-containing protein n=1 Tax=uncultured Helicobacter sp. TaxID=175537 RepID=UPI00374F2541